MSQSPDMIPGVSPREARQRVYDLIVVGAGVAGAAVALSCAEAGQHVLMIEEGGLSPLPTPDADAEHDIAPGSPHDPRARTNARAIGGALHKWGGRCVPFDPEDFGPRGLTSEPGWPITYEDYARWIGPASEFVETDPVYVSDPPGHWSGVTGLRSDRVERLNPLGHLGRLQARLAAAPNLSVLSGAVVTGLQITEPEDGVRHVTGVVASDGEARWPLRARRVVLACGGLETARLLLIAQRADPSLFGGIDGPLGRYYMGHLTGLVAGFEFADPADIRAFRYVMNGFASPERRRLMLTADDLPSTVFWLENAFFSDAGHGSGELSAKYLLGGEPLGPYLDEPVITRVISSRAAHVANVLRDPGGTVEGLAAALRARRPSDLRHPNRLVARKGGLRLVYHAEHLPQADSRVQLGDRQDRYGRPCLTIGFSYDAATIDGVIDAHRRLAGLLQQAGLARVTLPGDDAVLRDRVLAQARDGYHQIGLTRMSARADRGVVDADCRVHGVEDLFVASASVFPVSGQANPTISVVALALRLGAHLAGPGSPVPTPTHASLAEPA
ncbi:MAG: GMC oxidoreductase [Marinibacterium sp.]|nr:GMC oxidoreductase [Marinibacterium sp.]